MSHSPAITSTSDVLRQDELKRLSELASELSERHGVRAEVVACDLSSAAARRRMMKTIADRGLDVEVLVNNAGVGSAGRFQELRKGTVSRLHDGHAVGQGLEDVQTFGFPITRRHG